MSAGLKKFNIELLKNSFKSRPQYLVKHYSQDVKDIFKFYSEEPVVNDKYRVLDEQDYQRFLSQRARRREPALTRTMSEYR